MKPNPPPTPSRHNVRAVGKTHTTISLSEAVLEKARRAASADERSLSKWLERLIAAHVSAAEAANTADSAPATSQPSKSAGGTRKTTSGEGSGSFRRSA